MEWEELEPLVKQCARYEALPEELHEEALKLCREHLPRWKQRFRSDKGSTLQNYLLIASMCTVAGVYAKHRRMSK